MKTLLAFLVSLFTFQALLFASAATEARSLLTLESWRQRQSNCGFIKEGLGGRPRRAPPPPPPGYSPGPTPKLKSPPSPYVMMRGSTYPLPPPPHISPGPVPKRRSPPSLRPFTVIGSLPTASEYPPALQDPVHDKSPPNPHAASA